MLRLMAIPLPVTIYAIVISTAGVLLGLFLLIRGSFPGWLPNGLVDPQGQRATLSPGMYRLLGVGCGLAGIAALVVTLGTPGASFLVAFGLAVVAFTCLLVAAAEAWTERRARSLRQTRSTILWTFVAGAVAMLVNYGVTIYLFSRVWRR
jgi:hypothetical protein